MFSEKLQEMVDNVGGGYAAIIMGFDGIALDSYTKDQESDIETIGMEFSVLIKEIQNASDQLDAGQANEISIKSEKFTTILRILNDEYFLAMAIATDGNMGKARYLLRLGAPELKNDLS